MSEKNQSSLQSRAQPYPFATCPECGAAYRGSVLYFQRRPRCLCGAELQMMNLPSELLIGVGDGAEEIPQSSAAEVLRSVADALVAQYPELAGRPVSDWDARYVDYLCWAASRQEDTAYS